MVVSLFVAVVTSVIWPTIAHVIWLAAATDAQVTGIVVVMVMVSAAVVVVAPVMAVMVPATPMVLIPTVPVIAPTAPTYFCGVSPTIAQVALWRIQVIVVWCRSGPSTSVIVVAPATTWVCIPAPTATILGWLSGVVILATSGLSTAVTANPSSWMRTYTVMLVCSLNMQGCVTAIFGFCCCDLFLWFSISSLLLFLLNPGERTMLFICSLLTIFILLWILLVISAALFIPILIDNHTFYTLFWYRRNRLLLTALEWLAFTIWVLTVLLLFVISISSWFWPVMLVLI